MARALRLVGLAGIALLVASCMPSQTPPVAVPGDVPGFWTGLWHGMIAALSFIVSLFSDDVRVYAYPNAGRWYDFGFMLGVGGFSGSVYAGGRSKKTE